MTTASARGLLLTMAMLSVLVVAATPANALFNPRGGAITASSGNSQFVQSGITVRCPTSTVSGRIDADGRGITARVLFSDNSPVRPRVTCTESALGSSVTVTTTGNVSIVSQSSVVGVGSSGDLVIPAGSSFVVRSLAGSRTIGAQTLRGCVTFNQASQTLNFRCTLIDTAGNPVTFTGSYPVTSGGPITIS